MSGEGGARREQPGKGALQMRNRSTRGERGGQALGESNLLNSVFKVMPRNCPNYSQIIRLRLIRDPCTVRLG